MHKKKNKIAPINFTYPLFRKLKTCCEQVCSEEDNDDRLRCGDFRRPTWPSCTSAICCYLSCSSRCNLAVFVERVANLKWSTWRFTNDEVYRTDKDKSVKNHLASIDLCFPNISLRRFLETGCAWSTLPCCHVQLIQLSFWRWSSQLIWLVKLKWGELKITWRTQEKYLL